MDDKRFFFQPVKKFGFPQPKQQCLQYLENLGIQMVIVTFDCKTYLTGGIIPLVQLITSTAYQSRRYYEVIPPDTPAKLYFDIDCAETINEEEFQLFEERFIQTIRERLRMDYFYQDWDTNCLPIILKSNGAQKFSIHYIFPVVFESTALMRSFVDGVVKSMEGETFAKYIDTTVYTAWRNFRLVENTKLNKMNHLVLKSESDAKTLFQQLLQCFVSVIREKKSLRYIHPDLDFLFPCKRIIKTTETQMENICLKRKAAVIGTTSIPEKYKEMVECVEQEEIEKKYPKHSYYRTFQQFNGSDFIDYVFSPGLPCPENNNRPHKSNKTYFKIDVQKGTVFYRCADPVCSKFPYDICPIRSLVSKQKGNKSKQNSAAFVSVRSPVQAHRSKKQKKLGRG